MEVDRTRDGEDVVAAMEDDRKEENKASSAAMSIWKAFITSNSE